jgi:DNA repair exonuclease SbcCD ATPase subunit
MGDSPYTGPERRAGQAAEIARLEAEIKALHDHSQEATPGAQELARSLARQASEDAIALAEKRGEERATLSLWQAGMEQHNKEQNGSLKSIEAKLEKLDERVGEVVNGLATKRATDATLAEAVKKQAEDASKATVSSQEFRRWAIGLIVTMLLAFAAAKGFRF